MDLHPTPLQGGRAAGQRGVVQVHLFKIMCHVFVMFFILKAAKLLRVPPEMEIVGADVSKHGGSAYPEQLEAK